MEKDYLTCADVVKLTGKTKKTVWNWCNSGKLKAHRPSGKDYVITREDFNRFWYGDPKGAN